MNVEREQILKPWLYKLVDNEVRMYFLEDLGRELRFVSSERDVNGHSFPGVETSQLKSSVFGKTKIYKFDKTS